MSMGWTPAHCAAEAGKVTILRALVAAGVPIDKKDKYGDTPRRLAETYGHWECVKFLKMYVADLCDNHIISKIDNKYTTAHRRYCMSTTLKCFTAIWIGVSAPNKSNVNRDYSYNSPWTNSTTVILI